MKQVLCNDNYKLFLGLFQKTHLIVKYAQVDSCQHVQVTVLYRLHVVLQRAQ